ncbi:MAG: hypothetical protein WC606_05515 [Candidatus Absconditabacterales bacterium]
MKKTNKIFWTVIIIASTVFTSCNYIENSSLPSEDVKLVKWSNALPDSIRTEIINYFDFLGGNEDLTTTKVALLVEKCLPHVPDSLISKIPGYYNYYYAINRDYPNSPKIKNTEIVITSVEMHCISKPTLTQKRIVSYYVKVKSADLRKGEMKVTKYYFDAEDQRSLIAISILLCFFTILFSFLVEAPKTGVVFAAIDIVPLLLSWYYLTVTLSIVLTAILLLAISSIWWFHVIDFLCDLFKKKVQGEKLT